tara:strand:+ start:695 stop:3280 length:2586 start_codon:yes stop_codon:yes gene_type:complete
MPIQQMLLGIGAKDKTYIDDIFSMFEYTGNNAYPKNIVNGIDLAGEGGAVWGKPRTDLYNWTVHDTEQGVQKGLAFNGSGTQYDNTGNQGGSTTRDLTNFNNNGFTLGTGWSASGINPNGIDVVTYTLRKCPGFFDVVKYTGNGSNRTISHSLGSIPGCIILKNLDSSENWRVYHKSIGAEKHVILNLSNIAADSDTQFNDTEPTASVFSVGTDDAVNKNGDNFVAYLFAGGESTADGTRCADFDGTNDKLYLSDHADWALGQTFTIEFWIKPDNVSQYGGIVSQTNLSNSGWYIYLNNDKVDFADYNGNQCFCESGSIGGGQWTHCALVNNSGTAQWYINGVPNGSSSSVNTGDYSFNLTIGDIDSSSGNYHFDGKISNLRIVKGTAVYTSAFTPPTKPLTNITNTKLLCLQNSTPNGYTVSPGNISEDGSPGPTASIDSPFDDPAGFVFGDSGNQNIVKCGSYLGGVAGQVIDLGFEPQWLLIKSISNSQSWRVVDSLRGLTADGINDALVYPNTNGAEESDNRIFATSRGFGLSTTNYDLNGSGGTYIYVAIRKSEGLVGKPVETATSAFAMDTGAGSSTIPNFDATFPVDFGLIRKPATSMDWWAYARLIQGKYLITNGNNTETSDGGGQFDSNAGFYEGALDSTYQSWMWKRHAGFDVVDYTSHGNSGDSIPHSLGKAPEMIIIKNRNSATPWVVGHKGLNGGTTPWNYYIFLQNIQEAAASSVWNNTAPTSTHFTLGNYSGVNDTDDYQALLFASVDGISKVGYYTGTGSSQTITLGFQPRFLMMKPTGSTSYGWYIIDTVRGWAADNDSYLMLNSQSNAGSAGFGQPTSTGWSIDVTDDYINGNGLKYIYYAHA